MLSVTMYGWLTMLMVWLYMSRGTKETIQQENTVRRLLSIIFLVSAFELVYNSFFHTGFLGIRFIPSTIYTKVIGLFISLSGIVFAIVARFQLGKNWSATVTIKKDHELVQTGPYAITRHPIYTGILFGLIGSAVIVGEWRGLLAIILLLIGMHLKLIKEENFMRTTFPGYDAYARKTKRLVPFIY